MHHHNQCTLVVFSWQKVLEMSWVLLCGLSKLTKLNIVVICLQLDEFQDVAHAQYRLLHALTSSSSSPATGQRQRVTIVGDGDQAIYDWRGADVLLFEASASSQRADPP